MNDIIKNIEAAQLREDAPQFNVGDTVKVYAKIKEGNRERIQVFEGTVLPSLFVRIPTASALRRPGLYIPRTLRRLKL